MRKQELKALSADLRAKILTCKLPADGKDGCITYLICRPGNKISRAVQKESRRQERKRG